VSLFALLILHIYLIIGVTARTKSNELFEQKEIIKAKIEEVTTLKELTAKSAADDVNIRALRARYEEIEQKQDANYELLRGWNKIWLAFFLKDEFQGKLRNYRETEYESQFTALENEIAQLEASLQSRGDVDSAAPDETNQREQLAQLQEALQEKRLERELDITRNRFFLNTFASEYVTVALERYILPLLYGLLGAVFFVLRALSKELQNLTYLPMTEINYRLRIPTFRNLPVKTPIRNLFRLNHNRQVRIPVRHLSHLNHNRRVRIPVRNLFHLNRSWRVKMLKNLKSGVGYVRRAT